MQTTRYTIISKLTLTSRQKGERFIKIALTRLKLLQSITFYQKASISVNNLLKLLQVQDRKYKDNLNLEAAALSATTSTLKLPALGTDIRLGGGAGNTRSGSEVLNGLTMALRTTEKDAVLASRALEGKHVEGKALTASLGDTGTGILGEAQGTDTKLRDLEETNIVGDGTNNDGELLLLALHEGSKLGEGEGGPVGLGHKKALEDNLVKVAVRASHEKAVELDNELKINIVTLGGGAAHRLVTTTGNKINTHGCDG
mmetsp:Transcript_34124/g.61531  ORF Transcript_34124/g.61531 Transcript_34124/m.61531 type:complete len:257 (+) Transcript_34124:647-1417(+)